MTLDAKPTDADPSAVAVLADGQIVGFLEAGLAPDINARLRRGRIVLAGPLGGCQDLITVFLGTPGDRLAGSRPTIPPVASSDGKRTYLVDTRGRYCTCPAGRWPVCRHKRLAGLTD